MLLTFNCSDKGDKDYDEKATLLYFSEMKTDIDGTKFYYVYSPLYEIVGKVSAETYAFIDWELYGFLSPYMYYEYFTERKSPTVMIGAAYVPPAAENAARSILL